MDYSEAINYIQSHSDMELGTAPIDSLLMTLDSVKSLMGRLQNPQSGRNTVHVAGSKGKGSTSTMIASILCKGGKKTSLYSSPHLHSYTERIQIDSVPVSEQEFADRLAEIRQAVEDENNSGNGPIVTFGILTALFFQVTRNAQAEWQVVEVGLGGAQDATNVFASKQVAVLTPVSIEHTALLGKTPAEIAFHKAGIIISGSTAVLAPQQDPTVKPVVEKRCREVGAELIDVRSLYSYETVGRNSHDQICRINSRERSLEIRLPLLGEHQIVNATTAVAVADVIAGQGYEIGEQAIVDGLFSARLAGRLEVLQERPLVVVDGAHNRESALVLREALQRYFRFRKCVLVLGVNNDKDVGSMIEELAPVTDCLIATRSHNIRSLDPEQIASNPAASDLHPIVAPSVQAAVDRAIEQSDKDDMICITGSLYVVAEAREHLLQFLRKT